MTRRPAPVGRNVDPLQEAHRRRVQEAFQRLAGLDCSPLPPARPAVPATPEEPTS
ncbi:hypothetical protein [Kitasatospora indigofera]|uniref:hypothetical protein n=1 Tax=Kitasatospora indigofera TaxID=67307 RepID=UPI00368B02B3